MKHQIKNHYTDAVLYECDVPNDVQANGMATRYTLEKAAKDRANLRCAYLRGANLTGANLTGANLDGANLDGANLYGANLYGANLYGARLSGANLDGANLDGANLSGANLDGANLDGARLSGARLYGANLYGARLSGANLDGARLSGANLDGANLDGANLDGGEKLIGERPVFEIGPIGSRCNYLIAYVTDKGIRLRAGCFFGDIDTFRNKLESTHCDNDHAAEYRAALVLIEKHAEIWTQKEAAIAKAEGRAGR